MAYKIDYFCELIVKNMDIDRYFANRCTIRNFTDKQVDPALLTRLLEEASHAPNTGNMQLYSVIVSSTEEEKKALAPLHFNQPCVMGCSVLLTFCIDIHRFRRWCEAGNAEEGFGNLQMLLASAIDTSLFAQQFNTLAELHGMGCCFLGTTAYNAPQIAEVLGCPDGVVPLVALAVGYPATEGSPSDRLPVSAIVHDGHYGDYDDDRIKAVYAEKEGLEESLRFIQENGKETLAQVYAEVRYPKSSNESFSESLARYLDKSFFRK